VCPICGPKHNREIKDGQYPPAHPRCRCWVNHEIPDMPQDGIAYKESILRDENKIRGQSTETGIFYDTDGNRLLSKNTGHTHMVQFTWDDLAKVDNTIFTHNHPSNASFSPDDIKFMIRNNLQEIRAVTRQGTYSMSNNRDVSVRKLNKAIRDGLKDEYTQFGSVDFDNLWKWVARKLDMVYSFERR